MDASRYSRLASWHEDEVEGGVIHGEVFERDVLDAEVELLFSRLRDSDGGLPRRAHRLRAGVHRRCFTGAEMLHWFNENTHMTRQVALQLGQTFIDLLYMHALDDEGCQHAFSGDERSLYRLFCDDDQLVLNCKRRFSGVARSAATILDRCIQALSEVWSKVLFASDERRVDLSVLLRSREFQSFENAIVALQVCNPQELKSRGDGAVGWWITVFNILFIHATLIEGNRGRRIWTVKPKQPFAYLIGDRTWTCDDIECGIIRGNRCRAGFHATPSKDDLALSESCKPFWPKGSEFTPRRRASVHSSLRGLAAFALLPRQFVPLGAVISNMRDIVPILDLSCNRDSIVHLLQAACDAGAICVSESDNSDGSISLAVPLFIHTNRADFIEDLAERRTAEGDVAVARWLLDVGVFNHPQEASDQNHEFLDQRRLLQDAAMRQRPMKLIYHDFSAQQSYPAGESSSFILADPRTGSQDQSRNQSERNIRELAELEHASSRQQSEHSQADSTHDMKNDSADAHVQNVTDRSRSSSTSLRYALDSVVSGLRHRLPSFRETDLPSAGEELVKTDG